MEVEVYRAVDALLARAASVEIGTALPPWPDLAYAVDAEAVKAWREWLEQASAVPGFPDALAVASPVLAAQVKRTRDGGLAAPSQVRRAVLSVMRYLLRTTGRATPFGLFAGIAPARRGARAAVHWAGPARVVAQVDSQWLTAIVDELEVWPPLLARLTVVANNLRVVRDGRVVLPFQARGQGEDTMVDASVRHTTAVAAIFEHARAPILVADLAVKLAAQWPRTLPPIIDATVVELVRQRLLVTSLRPPLTCTDPLRHVLAGLEEAEAPSIPHIAESLRDLRSVAPEPAAHNSAAPAVNRHRPRTLRARTLCGEGNGAEVRSAVDMRLGLDVVVPDGVVREAEAAARALTLLTPYPQGLPAWVQWHAAFLDRYGPDALVLLTEVVDPVLGLGFPATYRGSARTVTDNSWTARDEKLAALVQATVLRGDHEMVLDEGALTALAAGSAVTQVPAHVAVFVQLQARDPHAVDRGRFRLSVTGAARAVGATEGRFLHLLDATTREAFRDTYAQLPAARAGAMPVQVSCPPLRPDVAGLARAPAMLPGLLRLGEHPDSGDGETVALEDLAVGGDVDGLYLVWLSRRRLVEPTVLNAVEFRYHSHPLVRFLCEVTRARTAVYMPFSWGSLASLPYLPRLRYGRAVLAAARWNLSRSDLPGQTTAWPTWRDAFTTWQRTFRVPELAHLVEADNLLRLDLREDAHLALLRTHLDRHGKARLDEAPEAEAFGWIDGHVHEISIPLASTTPPLSAPDLTGRLTTRAHGHLPGASAWLYAKLHTHPDQYWPLLERVTDLLGDWAEPPEWWFLPYPDPEPHLRLRLRLTDPAACGQAAARVGAWADTLRVRGLLGHLQFDTYYPETGRFGHDDAMTAAETVFITDSAVALAQRRLASHAGMPAQAITSAGMVNMAISYAGGVSEGMRWLVTRLPHEPVRLDPAVREHAREMVEPDAGWATLCDLPGGAEVWRSWQTRADALAAHRTVLAGQRDPLPVLGSLLHLHHVRMHGIDADAERANRHLARSIALSWTATRNTP